MTQAPDPALLEAAAECIKAAGFDAMAREFIERPDYRERIMRAMYRNIRNDRRLGPDMAKRFYNIAARALGMRALNGL